MVRQILVAAEERKDEARPRRRLNRRWSLQRTPYWWGRLHMAALAELEQAELAAFVLGTTGLALGRHSRNLNRLAAWIAACSSRYSR